MYIEVLVEIKSKQVDKTFIYHVEESLEKEVMIGKRVSVPFGKQLLEGYVISFCEKPSIETKDIIGVLDTEPVLNEEMLELGKFLKEKTLSPLSACYSAMLPKALKASRKTTISKKMQVYLKLRGDYEEMQENATDLQKKVLALFENDPIVLRKTANKISSMTVKNLIRKGILEELEEEIYRYELKDVAKKEKKVLFPEQEKAVHEIASGFGTSKVYLLHGVTGSGKTEVYIELIEQVLQMGKTAIFLVPEIGLTPQLVMRFQERFSKIAVLHSGLSDGERYDEWRKILRNEANIVIGTRSAIFAPLKQIGIIIMDEEHSESYIQENSPRYHALDVAKKRSETHSCPVVLGSATPTLDSMARAYKKVYEYVPITKRANQKMMPKVKIIDMREEMKRRHPILSRELECKIIEKLNKKEQILLLLNRRGHSTTISCSSCGFTYRCPNCDITLTYHKSSNQLRCHYCGYTIYKEEVCPECKEDGLSYYGLGTEKLENYLEEVFPTAKVIRMDRDSTQNKGAYEKIITEFGEGKYDILLGTQMISKGLDFGNVSLVGILNADNSLNVPDYKSNERTFDLLCQACGRAGRKNTMGEVIVQTFYPDHEILKFVQSQDYNKFFQYEMHIRKTLKYPPFYYLCQITVLSKDYHVASNEANKMKAFLEEKIDSSSIILGPTTANMFLVNKVYHFEILIKYRFDEKLMPALKELDEIVTSSKDFWVEIDFR